MLIAAIIAFGVFYVLNPAWWGDPPARAEAVLEMRQFLLEEQTEGFGGYASTGDALTGLYRQAIITAPQHFEVSEWATYIADQIMRYEASIWRGLSFGVLLIPLLALGVWYLLRRTPLDVRVLIGIWALAMLLSVGLLTPIEWQRYYLPLYPAIGVLAGLGVAQITRLLQRRDR